jgi:hypothetical protein
VTFFRSLAALGMTVAVLGGCDRANDAAASPPPSEGGSPFGIDSALKLFRVGLEPMTELENAEPSVERAIARLTRIVQTRDTADLRRFVMTRREFAWLYYPTSHYTRRPTLQEPGLAWFLHLQHSEKGATRLIRRYGGKVELFSNECAAPPRVEGDNRLWWDCVQRARSEAGDTVVIRLFGGILERHGRFKIFSYSNDL